MYPILFPKTPRDTQDRSQDYVRELYRYLTIRRYLSKNPNPIMFLGNQKSGTTAIAGLFSELVDLPATLDFCDASTYRLLHQLHLGNTNFRSLLTRERLAFRQPIIKEPELTFLWDKIARYFPKARVVFIIRHPRDNIRSILDRLGLPGSTSDSWTSLSERIPLGWSQVVDPRCHKFGTDSLVATLARRWERAAAIGFTNRRKFLTVRYEDFLRDKEGVLLELADRLSLSPVSNLKDRFDHQFQPRGNQTVNLREYFGNENFDLIGQICDDRMKAFGY